MTCPSFPAVPDPILPVPSRFRFFLPSPLLPPLVVVPTVFAVLAVLAVPALPSLLVNGHRMPPGPLHRFSRLPSQWSARLSPNMASRLPTSILPPVSPFPRPSPSPPPVSRTHVLLARGSPLCIPSFNARATIFT
ncbi:hypothetical protein CONPUDRAFT_159155 [Coniophora puteana RWD-64-598 SS2]|uniref:Uncharacterized protein n=1 Tax=Coniophora puteana (strain RWD-64-598) TaxID=741705 RepID=A0A5M3MAR1_CONPW|nr:uncharacterized protein CONPUDRAFT_159151 [Coniophora puteana RWD-64-598 SS2]XP_007774402.1 uncharacterized protein CONPUDRAFT_159155 [Coniophora puteana RWD-64-598 SS2]EIW75716.1 hypothetical protein CONPUDRAFT_159151 [Coniophora puteana RWD-64-598 SS2]EIW75721.1 hypothetical protein CONPUDRAFT_159155 [Coniophora puteana RWD-64-598 SS2]